MRTQKYCSDACQQAAYNQKQREKAKAAIVAGESNHYLKIRFMVLRRDGFACSYCGRGKKEGVTLHVDHIDPKSNGGAYAIDNLTTACMECNIGKDDVLLSQREREKLQDRL